jgi:outer membrane receptor protein involved in Fe transport
MELKNDPASQALWPPLSGSEMAKSPVAALSNSLAGALPGLVVNTRSGEPGADQASINIRGIGTLGDNSPLIVIDGIPDRQGGLDRIKPNDIASLTVLKDASAAIYGARLQMVLYSSLQREEAQVKLL